MIGALVTAVTALALVAALVTVLTTGALKTAVRVLLDLLTAAGLLRLAGGLGWTDLASAAAIVALRQLLGLALGAAPPWSRRQSPPPCAGDERPLPLAVRGESDETGRITT
ncbi:hypothetical protein V6V47_10795 [Micromonospora sp. CPCC 205539]|uniref:hypothetical protein n=1 Tax=Micromonospora sp. CPCC 205539 TaxID=3122408 RepID=UPI002FF3C6EE